MKISRYILLSLMVSMLAPLSALAFFGDGENSVENEFSAGTLSFTATATTTSAESPASFDFSIENTGSHDPLYGFNITANTCSGVTIATSTNLAPFSGVHSVDISGTPANTCSFTLLIEAWQQGFAYASGGFTASTSIDYTVVKNAVQPGDVVINEIMWMGSRPETGSPTASNNSDEWIELRNTTGSPIDISGWVIVNAGAGSSTITIAAGKVIPANGYFLITNYATNGPNARISDVITADQISANMSLDNGGEQLVLKDLGGNVIDQTPLGAWPAGENGTNRRSMERNFVPGDGTLPSSWHTCVSETTDGIDGCNGTQFWDNTANNNYGTPKATNLSENDPTAPDFNNDPQMLILEQSPTDEVISGTSSDHVENGEVSIEPDPESEGEGEIIDENVVEAVSDTESETDSTVNEGSSDMNNDEGSTEAPEEVPSDTEPDPAPDSPSES